MIFLVTLFAVIFVYGIIWAADTLAVAPRGELWTAFAFFLCVFLGCACWLIRVALWGWRL